MSEKIMITNKKVVKIYTDGACAGNPGPGGWGAILIYNDTMKELYGSAAYTTNNKMEIQAAIEGLKALNTSCVAEIFTDSTYLKDGITKWIISWQKNNWRTANKAPVKNVELWQELLQLTKVHDVEWRWVRAHNGDYYNERADQLACLGRDEARNKNPSI
jgi:ribonuclease HI